MALGRFAVAGATFLACLCVGENAIALGRLLAPAGTERPIPEVRLAVAIAPRQTTLWWSLELHGPKRRVALVVPAAPGASVDPASSQWFAALERATAPKIVLSAGGPLCGALESSRVHDTSEALGLGAIGVSEFAVLSSLDEVAAFAKGRGLEFAQTDRESLVPYSTANRFIAFSYDVPEKGGATETVRMTWRRPESKLMIDLISGGAKVPVTLWTIAGGRARLPPAREYEPDELSAVWKAAQSQSDYPGRRHAWLDSRHETTWLIETAGDDVLYDWRLLPESSGAIQPVMSSYFVEDAAGACVARVLDAKSDGRRVAPACAKGLLGIVEGPANQTPCVESVAAGEIDPEALRCGLLDDFALALADQYPDRTWVTRHRGIVLSQLPQNVEIGGVDSERVSPIVFASAVDVSGCGATGGSGGAGGASGAPGSSSGSGGWGGMGGVWTPPDRGGSGSTYPDDPYDPHPHTIHEGSTVDVGCTSSGGDADCGGDTSSGGDGDSCSGDSGSEDSEGCSSDSSDDESGGDDCGGDSSSDGGDCSGDSSSEGGDDCGGDSSSDGGDDCSGDSSGGDDCSGDSGGGDCGGEAAAMNTMIGVGAVRHVTAAVCSLPRPRRFRPRVSAVTLVLCAIALCLRRAGR